VSRVEVIGDATLYLGEVADLLPTLQADLILADPPYGIGESGRKNASRGKPFGSRKDAKNTRGTYVPPVDYGDYKWDEHPATVEELQACIKAGKHAVIWGANHFGMTAASKWLVWDKLNSGDFADCELAWTNLPGAVRIFRHMWNGMLRDSERDTSRVHLTQKPIALMAWCIEQMSSAAVIGEPWCGSAPGGCAAVTLGLKWWGIERDAHNFSTACRRIEQAYKQRPLFEAEPVRRPEQLGLEAQS
jgi:DNA modification methylase